MGKNATPEESQELPGQPLDRFRAAVRAIVALRDSGEFLVFLARRGSVKIIGDVAAFRQTYAKELNDPDLAEEPARAALEEVRRCTRLWGMFESTAYVVDVLGRIDYQKESGALGKKRASDLRALLKAKVECASEHLFTDGMRDRAQRMRTATGPCLEDLDVELVQERRDDFTGRSITAPFLRLRVRYTEARGASLLVPWLLVGPGAIGQTADSFELEGDETDVDLLMTRLTAAKNRLLDARGSAEG